MGLSLYDVIRRPIITERSTQLQEQSNKITFEVSLEASKVEIRKAVEKLFSVKVLKVRTMRVRGKKRRLGRSVGQRPDWKKAIVTLAKGERINLLEGM